MIIRFATEKSSAHSHPPHRVIQPALKSNWRHNDLKKIRFVKLVIIVLAGFQNQKVVLNLSYFEYHS